MKLNPQKIIAKYLKKDYPGEKVATLKYNNFERVMIKNLKKHNITEIHEKKFETDMELQMIEITDFDKFIGIRLGYYAIVLALFAIILSNQELVSEMTFDIKDLVYGITGFMIFLIVTHNLTTDNQRERLIYYRFKSKCIDKVLDDKEIADKNSTSRRKKNV